MDVDLLKQLTEEDPQLVTWNSVELLRCSHTAIERHLNELDKTCRYGICIPHELSSHQLRHSLDTCMGLMTSHRNYEWLRTLITGDEKRVLYINCTHKRQWLSAGRTGVTTPKTNSYPKKGMLSMWCGVKGIIRWDILPNDYIINADLYYQQKDRITEKSQREYESCHKCPLENVPYVKMSFILELKDFIKNMSKT